MLSSIGAQLTSRQTSPLQTASTIRTLPLRMGMPMRSNREPKADMKMTIAGTPDSVAAKVRQLAEMGINHLHLRFMGEVDGETGYVFKDSAELQAVYFKTPPQIASFELVPPA